jgi:hypothetical protein
MNAPRTLTDTELAFVAFAYLGARAPHFVEFIGMTFAVDADTPPVPVCDYEKKLTTLLYAADYGHPN